MCYFFILCCLIFFPLSPMASCTTCSSLFSGLLPLCLLFCAQNIPRAFSPQSLWTCYSFCLEHSFSSLWHVFISSYPIPTSSPHPPYSQNTLFVFFMALSTICNGLVYLFTYLLCVYHPECKLHDAFMSESLESRTVAQKAFEKHCFILSSPENMEPVHFGK